MAKKVRIKHEWHLYSITVFGLVAIFFCVTAFKDASMVTTALTIVTVFVAPFMASDNWKQIPSNVHKSLITTFLIFFLSWAMYLIYVNKIYPRASRKLIPN